MTAALIGSINVAKAAGHPEAAEVRTDLTRVRLTRRGIVRR